MGEIYFLTMCLEGIESNQKVVSNPFTVRFVAPLELWRLKEETKNPMHIKQSKRVKVASGGKVAISSFKLIY